MRNSLLIAVPAFVVGSLVSAGLTSTARAQKPPAGTLPRYHIAATEKELNEYAKIGYSVTHVTSEDKYTYYLMAWY